MLWVFVLLALASANVPYCIVENRHRTRYGSSLVASASVAYFGGEVCEVGQVCEREQCIDYECSSDCGEGEICAPNGMCRSVPPKMLEGFTLCTLRCGPNEVCANGECTPISQLKAPCIGDNCDVPQNSGFCDVLDALIYEERPDCGETDVGQCYFGKLSCVAGIPTCVGYVGPVAEDDQSCQHATDADCDGLVGCADPDCALTPACCTPTVTCGPNSCGIILDNGCGVSIDCGSPDNGVFCDGVETCSAANEIVDGPDPTCNDNSVCTIDSCDAYSDQCVNTPISIDDGFSCTIDACDPITGVSNTPDDSACPDSQCKIGVCDPSGASGSIDAAGCALVNRADSTVCTTGIGADGTCQSGVCVEDVENICFNSVDDDNNGLTDCADSDCEGATRTINVCLDEKCQGGVKIDVINATAINDANSCTTDSCDRINGISNVPVADGASCPEVANGVCQSGVCVCVPIDCAANPCAADGCGGVCPPSDSCSECVGNVNTPINCDDSNECTNDVCNGGVCSNNAVADQTVCANGAGTCSAGVCVFAVCGNGIVEDGEGCDLGDDNGILGIGCTSDCLVEGDCMVFRHGGLLVFRQLGVYQFTHPFNALENPTLTACGGAGGGSSGNPLIQEFGRYGRSGVCADKTFNSVVKGQTYFFSIASGGVPGGPLCSGSEAGGAGQSQSLNFPGFNLIGNGGLGGSGTTFAPGDANPKIFNIRGVDNSEGGSGGQLIQNGICPASGAANGGDGEPAAGGGGGGLVNTTEGGDCGNGFCAGSGGFGGNGVVIRRPFFRCSQYAVCGNGILERGESCDDGNLIDGDGCPSTCVTEVIVTPELINQWTDSGPEGESATSLARLSTADLAIDLDIPTVGFLTIPDQAFQFAYFFGSAISNYMIADPSIFVNPLISKFNAPTVLVNRNNPAISYTCTVTSGPAWVNFVGALAFRNTLNNGCLNQYILLNDQAGVTTLDALVNLEFHVSMGFERPCFLGSTSTLGVVNGRCASIGNPCDSVGCGPFERCNEDNGQCYLWIDDETCGSPTNNCTDQNLLCSRISLENSQPYKCVECREDAQCPYPGAVCSLGGNDPGCKNPPNGPCTATADCIDGLICESNECKVPEGGNCDVTSNCAAGLICDGGVCVSV